MFEDRTPIWPQGKKKARPEAYPWRVEAEPVLVLPRIGFVPAEELATKLEHVRKWPPDHWHLAFQGQLRTIGDADARLLRRALEVADRRGRRVTDEGTELVHERHFTREEANALLPQLTALLGQLREAEGRAHRHRGSRGALRGGADQRRRRGGAPGGGGLPRGEAAARHDRAVGDRAARHRPGADRLPRACWTAARSISAGSSARTRSATGMTSRAVTVAASRSTDLGSSRPQAAHRSPRSGSETSDRRGSAPR